MSWLDAEGAKTNAYNSMVKVAIDYHMVTEKMALDRVKLHTHMDELIREFEAFGTAIGEYDTMAAMLGSWEAYLIGKIANPQKSDTVELITMTITQHYGKVDITLGISDTFVIGANGDRLAAVEHLRRIIDELHIEQQRTLPQAAFAGNQHSAGGGEVVLDVTAIRKSNERGKMVLRVLGGKWSQHGVPLYNEVAERAGLDYINLPYGDNRYVGKAVVLLRDNGAPQKVLSIE